MTFELRFYNFSAIQRSRWNGRGLEENALLLRKGTGLDYRYSVVWLGLLLFLNSCGPKKESRIQFDAGNYREAINLLQQELASDSTNADAWQLLGRAYEKVGLLDSAVFAVKKAHTIKSHSGSIRRELARLYILRGKKRREEKAYKTALNDFEAAGELQPNLSEVYYQKALTYLDAGYLDKAESNLKQAAERSKNDPRLVEKQVEIAEKRKEAEQLYQQGKALYDRRKWTQAARILEKAVGIYAEHHEAKYYMHMARGRRLYKKGSVTALWDAITEFGYAANIRPGSPEPLYYMARSYEKKDRNDFSMPVEVYQKVIDVAPDSELARKAKKRIAYLTNLKKKLEKFWGKKLK